MSVRPAHLSQPRATPMCRDVAEALQRMRDDGHSRVAIWGAGDHTRRNLGALYDAPIEIACLVDDEPRLRAKHFCGWTVHSVNELLARADVTAVLISTRYPPHVERMWPARERFEAAGKQLYRLPLQPDARPADLALPAVLAITMPKSGTWLLMRLLTHVGFEHYRGNAALARLANSGAASAELAAPAGANGPTNAAHRVDGSTICDLIPAGHVATFHDPRLVDNAAVKTWIEPGHCRVVLLIRDPRDIVVARAHFWKHPDNPRNAMLRNLDTRDVMDRLIEGYGSTDPGINELMLSYRLLYESPLVHVVRFEEIVRAIERPADSVATAPIKDLMTHIGLRNFTKDRLLSILQQLELRRSPGRTRVVNEWQEQFGPKEHELFEFNGRRALTVYGYGANGS